MTSVQTRAFGIGRVHSLYLFSKGTWNGQQPVSQGAKILFFTELFSFVFESFCSHLSYFLFSF